MHDGGRRRRFDRRIPRDRSVGRGASRRPGTTPGLGLGHSRGDRRVFRGPHRGDGCRRLASDAGCGRLGHGPRRRRSRRRIPMGSRRLGSGSRRETDGVVARVERLGEDRPRRIGRRLDVGILGDPWGRREATYRTTADRDGMARVAGNQMARPTRRSFDRRTSRRLRSADARCVEASAAGCGRRRARSAPHQVRGGSLMRFRRRMSAGSIARRTPEAQRRRTNTPTGKKT